MSNIFVGDTSLYALLCYFVIFSFLGWLMETVRVSIKSGKYVNRGFANGPYCPIYGFGMSIVIVLLSRFKNNIPILFLCGMLLTTLLEYVTAYLLELIFKAKWWDYSYKRLNFKGRICLDISIAWGVLAVIMIEFAVPVLEQLINKIPVIIGEIVVVLIITLMCIDVIVTAKSIISFKNMLYKLADVRKEIKEEWDEFSNKFSENLREYIDIDEFSDKIEQANIKAQDYRQRLAQRHKLIKDLTIEEFKLRFADRDFNEEKLAAINKIRNMYARYSIIKKMNTSKTHRRILGAFPGFRANNEEFQHIIKSIKDSLKNK